MALDLAENKVVVFRVGREEYAVPIQAVKEVVPWSQPTPVIDAPPIVDGVIDLRGEVIPVVDMARRFGTVHTQDHLRIMVMEVESGLVGFVVDAVSEVYDPKAGSAAPPSPILRQHRGDPVVAGILRLSSERLVVLIDVAWILDTEALAAVATGGTGRGEGKP